MAAVEDVGELYMMRELLSKHVPHAARCLPHPWILVQPSENMWACSKAATQLSKGALISTE
jgi:hypothetical protein